MKRIIICAFLALMMLLGACALSESADLTGNWRLTSVRMEGIALTPAEIGLDMTLILREDGTVMITATDEEDMQGTWMADEAGVRVTLDGEELLFFFDDEYLVISDDEISMVFGRDMSDAFNPGSAVAAHDVTDFDGLWICTRIRVMGMVVPIDSAEITYRLSIVDGLVTQDICDGGQGMSETLAGDGELVDGKMLLTGEGLDGQVATLYDSGILEIVQPVSGILSLTYYYEIDDSAAIDDPQEPVVCYKPVIYLYPESETDIDVALHYDGKLTCTWPEYGEGWVVTAQPDGTLTDRAGNVYSYLFWEGTNDAEYDFSAGFCVPGSETAEFLRAALKALGLTPREYNEFIVFWLPRLQDNPYNLIAFQGERYTDHARLEISPAPDTVLRVFMAYRPLNERVEIAPQELLHTPREGFTVVEWGGAQAN